MTAGSVVNSLPPGPLYGSASPFSLDVGRVWAGVPFPSEPNPAPKLVARGTSLEELKDAAEGCTACELYRDATQVVFGAVPPPPR